MHGGYRVLKRLCIRVEEIHLLNLQSPFFGGVYGNGPLFALNLIYKVKALVKDGSLLRTQAVQKSNISDEESGII